MKCKCGEKFGSRFELLVHLDLLRPMMPPRPNRLNPWLTPKRADELWTQYEIDLERFNFEHGKA